MAAFVLLALAAHAFLTSATHFHRIRATDARESFGLTPDEGRFQRGPEADSGQHAQCALCGLQRSFITDLGHLLPSLPTPWQAAPTYEPHGLQLLTDSAFLAPSGRAPPLS